MPHAHLPLPMGEVPSAHTGRRGLYFDEKALSVAFGDSSPRGRAKCSINWNLKMCERKASGGPEAFIMDYS